MIKCYYNDMEKRTKDPVDRISGYIPRYVKWALVRKLANLTPPKSYSEWLREAIDKFLGEKPF